MYGTVARWRVKDGKETAKSVTILAAKKHEAPSVFEPANLLREARRQRNLPDEPVPRALMLTSWPALSARSAPTVHLFLGRLANGSKEYQRMAFS